MLRLPEMRSRAATGWLTHRNRDPPQRSGGAGIDKGRRTRRKHTEKFHFTDVPFRYDPDDYFYLPGLYRSSNQGFLQPVFFKRGVLLKYDNAPGYRVKFASTTYGQIDTECTGTSFGINRHGNVVM